MYYSNAQYEPFPPFLYPTLRAMLRGRNGGLIRTPTITENDGFFISRWYAIPEYSGGVFAVIAVGGGDDLSALSIHGNPDPNLESGNEKNGGNRNDYDESIYPITSKITTTQWCSPTSVPFTPQGM